VYKGSSIDWKRIRLAAQLKAASEGLDASIAAFDHLARGIVESPWRQTQEEIEVGEYVVSVFETKRLPSVLRPASVSRFSGNCCALFRSIQPRIAVHDAVTAINNELPPCKEVPVSLSLYQLFLGILCKSGRVQQVKNIRCHVTPELVMVFPDTKKLTTVFEYDA
jgi:hypothetical protein